MSFIGYDFLDKINDANKTQRKIDFKPCIVQDTLYYFSPFCVKIELEKTLIELCDLYGYEISMQLLKQLKTLPQYTWAFKAINQYCFRHEEEKQQDIKNEEL